MSLLRAKTLELHQNEGKPVQLPDGRPLLDELVFQNVDLHIEQMSHDDYWLGITDSEGNDWHFHLSLNANPPASLDLVCTDHPGEEADTPFPPPEKTSPPNFPEGERTSEGQAFARRHPLAADLQTGWEYRPSTESFHHYSGYALIPEGTGLLALKTPEGRQISQSKYIDFLIQEAQTHAVEQSLNPG